MPGVLLPQDDKDLTLAVENLRRELQLQIKILDTRIDDRDRATEVLHETVTRIPTDVQREVTHVRELMSVELAAVAQQFKERDTRAEREARDNKIAVDAAFAAQEKLAVQQNEGNQVAIQKSEKATNESIDKNSQAAEARANSIQDKVDDLKERLAALESQLFGLNERIVGNQEQKVEHRSAGSYTATLVGSAIGIAGFVAFILGLKN